MRARVRRTAARAGIAMKDIMRMRWAKNQPKGPRKERRHLSLSGLPKHIFSKVDTASPTPSWRPGIYFMPSGGV